jgi:hypothetical protein
MNVNPPVRCEAVQAAMPTVPRTAPHCCMVLVWNLL